MAIMRVTCELAGALRFSMAVMRRMTLLEQRAARIITGRCCTGCFLPESPVCSMFPSGRLPVPHTGKLKPGPSRGPVFYRALLSARHSAKSCGVNVVRAPRFHAIVRAESLENELGECAQLFCRECSWRHRSRLDDALPSPERIEL